MHLFKCLCLLLLATMASRSFAWGLKELGQETAAPVTTDAKYVFWAGSALTLVLAVAEDQVGDPFDDKQTRNKTLGDSSRFGDWLGQLIPNALYVTGMGISASYGNDLS